MRACFSTLCLALAAGGCTSTVKPRPVPPEVGWKTVAGGTTLFAGGILIPIGFGRTGSADTLEEERRRIIAANHYWESPPAQREIDARRDSGTGMIYAGAGLVITGLILVIVDLVDD